jgi:UDP-2,3-diacylglucosamine hydrolase
MDIRLQANSQYINIGDWIVHFTYGVLDKNGLTLATWED